MILRSRLTRTFTVSLSILFALGVVAEELELEEIVVTGSYIKRDSFDSASPLTIIDQASIEANATTNLGEVLADQTFNYGSMTQTNTFAARPQWSSSTTANLRGLGENATLNLIDGKRMSQRNMNNAIPQVAIQRIEILKDGASALYGTDAVAGVVNIITRKNFSGIKASFFYTEDRNGDLTEEVFDIIAGADTDNGHFTMALSTKRRTELQILDRPDFARTQWSKSGTGNPGTWRVPNRDPISGILDGNHTRTPDPGCGIDDGPGGKDQAKRFNYLSGQLSGSTCQFHFGETWNYMNPHEQFSFWTNFRYDFSDNLSNEFDILFTRLDTESRGSPQNPGGRIEEFPIVLGDHPGNPFRAFADANGNGVIDDGERLYAQDADGDGIPDRGTVDLNGDGVLDVILAANPFDSASGIPFNEDVDVIALRALGKIGLLPGANQPSAIRWDGANNGNLTFDTTNWRITDTLTYTIPNSSWEVAGTLIYSEDYTRFETKNSSQTRLELGLRGELDPDPDPTVGKQYWNPFATQALNCVDRICTSTGVPTAPNSVAILDSVHFNGQNLFDTEFLSVNVIATGDIYELPAGTLQSAFGIEWRKTSFSSRQGPHENSCDWHEGGCEFDWAASQDISSAFYELVIPVVEGLELNLAGRYSDYGGGIGDSFDPKFTVLWQPLDILSVRASFSSAFIAPDLEDQFGSEDCGLQTMVDPLTNDFQATFRVRCLAGNAALTPETADVFNIGFSLSLFDGDLSLGLDYANYDFKDRIAETTGQQVIDQDLQRFAALGNSVDNAAQVAAWIAGKGTANGECICIIRDTTNVLTRVLAGKINAQTMEHTAYDLYARYNLNTAKYGTFVFTLNATFADEFKYDLGIGAAGKGDGAGRQNETIQEVPPIPEWRAVGQVNWFRGGHSAMIKVRWIDEFFQDIQFFGAFNPPTIESMTYTDINYAYTFDSLVGDRETKIEIGARNVFDEFPTPIFNLGGIETFVHDIRGRMVYLRINQDI